MRLIFCCLSLFVSCSATSGLQSTSIEIRPSTCGQNVFEGVEKRVELYFAVASGDELGLRAIPRLEWDGVCDLAGCLIIHQERKPELDSYVLSESSLFVFRDHLMMKTCGTTVPLSAVDRIVRTAASHGLSVVDMVYSRSNFMFPDLQSYPHHSNDEELEYLESMSVGGTTEVDGETYVLGNAAGRYWLVHYKRFGTDPGQPRILSDKRIVVDCVMTGLAKEACDHFFQNESLDEPSNAKIMSDYISHVLPDFDEICGKSFPKCGYSCNAHDAKRDIAGDRYFTIHVTPEESFSYASVEAVFYAEDEEATKKELEEFVKRVATVFQPSSLAVAVLAREGVSLSASDLMDSFGEYVKTEESHAETVQLGCRHHASQVVYGSVDSQVVIV
jgi:S-adenosylmethionine decarboxylase